MDLAIHSIDANVPVVFETGVKVLWDPEHFAYGLASTAIGGGVLPTLGRDGEVVGFS